MDYRRQQKELERERLARRRDAFIRLPLIEQHRLVLRVVEKAFAVRSQRIRLANLHNIKGERPDVTDIERRERNLYSCGFKRDQVGGMRSMGADGDARGLTCAVPKRGGKDVVLDRHRGDRPK